MDKKQKQMAEKVRELYEPTEFIEVGSAFTLGDAIAKIIDGTTKGILPWKMQTHFNLAWKAYGKIITAEHKEITKNLLGDKRFEAVINSGNSAKIDALVIRIAERVAEEYGSISPGVKIEIDVEDIFAEINFDDDELGV